MLGLFSVEGVVEPGAVDEDGGEEGGGGGECRFRSCLIWEAWEAIWADC